MKNKIKKALALAVCLLLLTTNAFAYSLDFSSLEYTGLNNGDFCVRSVESDLSYKCSGSGEIGFRIVDCISEDVLADENHAYLLSAHLLAESAADGGEYAKIKAAVTTPGGFVGKEEEFEVPVGEWTEISMSFAPQGDSAFDTVSFSSSDGDNGADVFYVNFAAVEIAGEKYEVVKTIDFAKAVYTGGGANGGLYESGVRIGYTLSANQFPFESGNTKNLIMQVNAGGNMGLLIANQLPELTAEDIGKIFKISIKALPYDTNIAGTKLTGYLGTSNIINTFAYPTDYTESEITVMSTWANGEYTVLEHDFVVTEELLNNRSVVLWVKNTTSLSPLTFMIDDMTIATEKEY